MIRKKFLTLLTVSVLACGAVSACNDSGASGGVECKNKGGEIFLTYSPLDPKSMIDRGATDVILGEAYDSREVITSDGWTGTRFKLRQSATLLGAVEDRDREFETLGTEGCPMDGFPTIKDGYSGAFFFHPVRDKKQIMGAVQLGSFEIAGYASNPGAPSADVAALLAIVKGK